MLLERRPWREELEIIDRTMKAISGIRDPEDLVDAYWNGIGELVHVGDYVALSRRNVEAPYYLVTRSSRFTEEINPWTQRERLPRLTGGLLGEIAYADKPVFIEDLPKRLKPDDPGHFHLQGFGKAIALPQYDGGAGINVTVMLFPPGTEIDWSVIPVLHWQSGLFGRGTQNLVLRNQLSEALANLDRELQVVGEIQRSLLPSELPPIDGFDLAAYYLTSARAGGDYYDFFPLEGGSWGVFIADVSGHGTPAAVLMAITHAIAHAKPGMHWPPAALLKYLNERLARSYTQNGTFVTAFYAVLNPVERTLTYSTAGHNPPRLVRGEKVISLDQAGALPLGILPDLSYTDERLALEKGDLLMLYTDGITEAMGPRRSEGAPELFGTDRLDRVLLEGRGETAASTIALVREAVESYTHGAPANDDRTLVAMRVK